ncbi:DinB family protein [Emticicia sp. SJ17W-69]|uniref:DinB family protein n=1 Tax=Emticicia sp. SJ17W-69 TaxID=3421657 RepID=UPI003EBCD05B
MALEVWLRGPLPDVPLLLQPVAHALLQAQEEVAQYMQDFSEENLWKKPAGLASVGFHLQHLRGVLDRLFTYARGEALSQTQLEALAAEGKENTEIKVKDLVEAFNKQIALALIQLKATDTQTLTHVREVGRGKIPSTVNGLLVHAAEHTTRHLGQLLVTAKVVKLVID